MLLVKVKDDVVDKSIQTNSLYFNGLFLFDMLCNDLTIMVNSSTIMIIIMFEV